MTVSVIISTYNRVSRLKKAIKSVLDQTYDDFELIVVDDHSPDNTKKYLETIKDKRVRTIFSKKNFGCDTKPKNEGIMASQGKYIAFLDDDNVYRPDHLEILVEELEKDDKIDIVYGDRWVVDEKGEMAPQVGAHSDFDAPLLMQRNYIDTSDVLIKREALFDVGGFDERYKKYIDWNLWVRMMKFGKRFKRVPLVITNYYLHDDMKSQRVKDKVKFQPEWDAYDLEIVQPFLGQTPKEPNVAIYTITYNRLEYTKQSFKTLKETAGYPYDHFVVDNGSTDGTRNYLVDYVPAERRLIHGENHGISRASNQAVDMIVGAGGYDIIMKWDNDCMGLSKGWLAKMVELWKSSRMLVLSCYVQGLNENPGGAQRMGHGKIKGELLGITKHLGGICHFTDAHAYDNFRWDEDGFLHGVQDIEFSQYLFSHGYTMAYLENYYVSHGPRGTNRQKKDYPEYFEKRVKEKQTRYKPDTRMRAASVTGM